MLEKRLIRRILLVVLVTLCGSAEAYHTEVERYPDHSAYTLQQNEWRLGLANLDYGIIEQLTVGTYWPTYIALAFGAPIINAHLKGSYDINRTFTVGLFVGIYYLDLNNLDLEDVETSAKGTVLPVVPTLSIRHSQTFTSTYELIFVNVFAGYDASSVDVQGGGLTNNLQMAATLETRFNRVIALQVRGRILLAGTVYEASSEGTLDDGSTVQVNASLDNEGAEFAWSVVPSAVFSWKHFNLSVGVGYGHMFLPGIMTPTSRMMPIPEFAAFFRF